MLLYLVIGLILGLVCGAISAKILKDNASTSLSFLGIAPDAIKEASLVVLAIHAILFLILWKLMIFLWLVIMGIFYVCKQLKLFP